jgi:hypothetical protein
MSTYSTYLFDERRAKSYEISWRTTGTLFAGRCPCRLALSLSKGCLLEKRVGSARSGSGSPVLKVRFCCEAVIQLRRQSLLAASESSSLTEASKWKNIQHEL